MKILITAGPTREPIDPARFLSNRSSGRMGYALARVARQRGHEVILVSGPVCLRPPAGVRVVSVTTAAEMLAAVRQQLAPCQALIMAAAVADWQPSRQHARKLKKEDGVPLLRLKPAPDILRAVRPLKGRRLFLGFAAETHNLQAEAQRKLVDKGLDAIAANDISRHDAGFEVATNRITFIEPGHAVQTWPLLSKQTVARRLIIWLEERARSAPPTARGGKG